MTLKTCIVAATAMVAAFTWPVYAAENYQKGEKTVGLTAGYHTYNQSGAAGVIFTYRFSRHFRLAPDATYIFRHHDTDALQLNVNAQVPFMLGQGWDIFPLAGLNYSSWNRHGSLRLADDNHDVGNRTSRLGINLGAGANVTLSESLRLGISGRYTFVKGYNGAMFLASISYRF